MLHDIRPAESTTPSENAVDLLVACHQRIRHFTSGLRNLSHAEGATLEEISSAASAAHRYFSIALPLHEADEEETVRPRLAEIAKPELASALAAMAHQHQAVDDVIERLLPILVLLSKNPAKLPETHGELCGLTSALDEIFRGHLALEEEIIFPALRTGLPPGALAEVLREMQHRRKQG